MTNHRRTMAIGCALASFIVVDGFGGTLCAAQPTNAGGNERQQFLEWCGSSGPNISYDLVIRGCSEVIQTDKDAPKKLAFAFANRGNGYVSIKDYDRAIADFTEATKLDPEFVAAYSGRAGAYSDQGDVDHAVADYIQARRLAHMNDPMVLALPRAQMPSITAVNLESPTYAMPKSSPILLTPLRSNGYAALDVQDKEPVVEPGKPSARETAAPPAFNRADNDPVSAGQQGFLFAESHVRPLTRPELQKLTAEQLQIARNEIYARRGRHFKDDKLSAYFAKFEWYRPSAWDVALNPIEKANVELIRSIEPTAAMRSDAGQPVPAAKPKGGGKLIRAAKVE